MSNITTDLPQIPARIVNEFVYCPRLEADIKSPHTIRPHLTCKIFHAIQTWLILIFFKERERRDLSKMKQDRKGKARANSHADIK